MEIAKRIQTELLPPSPALAKYSGLDIFARMAAADSVGGDYYDVIDTPDGRSWFLIGDVSGHGLVSGLIMMMAQTSIRSILTHTPAVSPVDLLASVNKAIVENLHRLGESRYMTLTAFAVSDGNKICFSGMHQDVLIYRARAGLVEKIDTSGMWIGICDDIKNSLKSECFHLEDDDVLLLYTDGVTEAYKKGRGDERDEYGVPGLTDLLQKCGTKKSSEIGQQLTKALSVYQTDDDVTFVVVKKNPVSP